MALGSGVGSNVYVLKNRIQDGSLIWAMSLRQTSAGYSDTEFLVSLQASRDGYYVYVIF